MLTAQRQKKYAATAADVKCVMDWKGLSQVC